MIYGRLGQARRETTRVGSNSNFPLSLTSALQSVASKPTFLGPLARGQRCLIPADSFLEPNSESGRNEWWRFRRADGDP